MPRLNLTADELLSTTRAVRRRLDLLRAVEREVLEECVALAQQAPTGGALERVHFVIVTDASKRRAIGDIYHEQYDAWRTPEQVQFVTDYGDPVRAASARQYLSSADYLAEHLGEVPVHVIPCFARRTEDQPLIWQATYFADAHMPTWSFMLAARERGLGTCFTTLHLARDAEVADIFGIPHESVIQTGLVATAYSRGTDFRPGPRQSLASILHWDTW